MANTYYVATNGSNDNPGTLEQPFGSLVYAAAKLKPGDTLYARGGTYYLDEMLLLANSGTPDQRVVVESYPGETAILDGSNLSANNDIIHIVGQYIDFKGFEVRNSPRFGIGVFRSKHIQILNNVVHGSYDGAIRAASVDDLTSTEDIVISGNTAYNNGLVKAQNPNGNWPAIIASQGASNVTITNNYVYNNYGEGIDFVLTNGGLASGNIIHDNYSANLYLDNASNIIVENNFIYTTNNTKYYRDGHPASGIHAANEPYGISNPLNNIEIRNNIVVGGKWGFYNGTYGRGGGMKNFTIVNNSFYGAASSLLWIEEDSGHENNVISKNIFYQTNDKPLTNIPSNLAQFGFSNNLWYGGTAGSAERSDDLKADPLFVNAGGLLPNDYALKAGSPALAPRIGSLRFNLDDGTTPVGGGSNPPPPIETGVPTPPIPVNKDIVLQVNTAAGDTVELLDLRGLNINGDGQVDSGVKVVFSEVTSEAKFDNSVGFYVVQNEQGTVIDPLSGQAINPGDPGYAEAALRQRVSGLDLHRNTGSLPTQLNGGVLLAPYVIADGTVEEFLAENPGNLPGEELYAYFAYQGANPDKADHVRLLGNNQFGFEDLWGGGDEDFNDLAFNLSVQPA